MAEAVAEERIRARCTDHLQCDKDLLFEWIAREQFASIAESQLIIKKDRKKEMILFVLTNTDQHMQTIIPTIKCNPTNGSRCSVQWARGRREARRGTHWSEWRVVRWGSLTSLKAHRPSPPNGQTAASEAQCTFCTGRRRLEFWGSSCPHRQTKSNRCESEQRRERELHNCKGSTAASRAARDVGGFNKTKAVRDTVFPETN